MPRFDNWASRLSEYLCANRNTRFGYGNGLDCGIFVADVVKVMTGVDPAAELRGKYASRKEAFAAIRSLCGRATMAAVAEYLAARCGCQEVPVAFAQRGDAVQIYTGARSQLGIIAMHGTEILIPGKDGIIALPREKAVRAWRIA
jgi:hypothetical protein